MSNIIKHFTINNSEEAVEILKSAGNEELFEKAKHQVGDIHPNGKWVWTEYAPGKFDWRHANGKHRNKQGGSSTQTTTSTQSVKPTATQSKTTSKIDTKQSASKSSKESITDAEKKRMIDDITQIFPDEYNIGSHLKHKDDDYLNKMLNLSDKLARDENFEKRERAFKWRNLIKDEISIRGAVKESKKKSEKLIKEVKSAKSPDDLLKIIKKDKHFVMRNIDYVNTYQYHINNEFGHELAIEIKDKKPLSVWGGYVIGGREYSTSEDSFETKKTIVAKYLEEAAKMEKRIAKGKQTLRVKYPYADVFVVTFNRNISEPQYGIKSNVMSGLDALKKYESDFNKILIYKDEKAAKAVTKGMEDYNKGIINHRRLDEIRKIYDVKLVL